MLDINNNPWLGLSSYQTADSFRFFGREREMEEIGASIKDNYCTILYGVSGAGKTSIINAGLCPKLAREGYMPITIRFDHNGPAYSNQIIEACLNKFKLDGTEFECPFSIEQFRKFDERDVLWMFFHTAVFWSNDNRKIVPILFIDQFEELFTLTKTESQIKSLFQQVDSLFGSVPSERLISRLESENISFDFSEAPHFRMVLSMREDFLARLEDYCYDLPILRRNRIGLRKMNGLQALDVIMKPAPNLITKDVALKVVSKVTGKVCSGNSVELQLLSVDTSILSLFCSELYKLAADKNARSITSELVDAEGGDIIRRFYENNISKLSRRGRRYLEQHLLTSKGFRNQLAVEDINHSYVSENDIKSLESARIIRKEIINGTERIEYTHDILCRAASESVRKTKERKVKLLSIISYISFSLVCLYFVRYINQFFSENISYLNYWGEDADKHDLLSSELKDILMILYGLIYLPLSLPTCKKKNLLADSLLILLGVTLAIASPRLYWQLNGVKRLLWNGWVVLLTIIPIVNIFSSVQKCSFREYLKSVFKFPSIGNDKLALTIFYLSVFWGLWRLLKEFHYTFVRLDDQILVRTIACLSVSIVTITFYIVFIHVFAPSSSRKGKKDMLLISSLIVLLFFYLLTQYSHVRWISYVLFSILMIIAIFYEVDNLKIFFKDRRYLRMACCLVSFLILYFAPIYVSNINILSLKENAKALDNRGFFYQAKIVSPDGCYGIMEGSDIIIPPVYKKIGCWYHSWEYNLFGFGHDGRICTFIHRLFGDPSYAAYNVRDENGTSSDWFVMEHTELNNKYTRAIPQYSKTYPTDRYITELLVDYYYHKKEEDSSYEKNFDIASEHLFLLNCKDKIVNGFVAEHPDESLLEKLQDPDSQDWTITIKKRHSTSDYLKTSILEDPNTIYSALKLTLRSKAISSDALIQNILSLVDEYSDSQYYSAKARCKGLIKLIQKDYDEAIKFAKMASDDEILAEALILAGKTEEIESFDNLLIRTNDNGQFLGEVVAKDIEYLRDLCPDFIKPCDLNRYYLLPQIFKESISLDLTRVRRTLYNGKVLFIEKGDVVSRYEKIVYPEINYGDNYIGVYFNNGKRGYIDSEGNELTGALFDHAWIFSDYNELAVVEVNGKIGFINKAGKYTVSPNIQMQEDLRYYKDWVFDEDGFMSFPGPNRKFGLLDSNGKWVVRPQFGDVGDCTFGFRRIEELDGDQKGLIDRKGVIVFQPRYQSLNIDSKYIEVRDSSYVISYFKHDGGKILGKVLERE